mmetsp:Transcript_15689/g.50185  ORF Transcript_15689/g.50185 Transcript_15689/m.50185 type:complete len:121 (+) Transcript_15689:94-456(+)
MRMTCGLVAAVAAAMAGAGAASDVLDVSLKGLSAEGSSLGLQRSAKLVRGQPPPPEEAPEEDPPPSFADVSVLGLQRSANIVRGKRVVGRQDTRQPVPVAAAQTPRAKQLVRGLQHGVSR